MVGSRKRLYTVPPRKSPITNIIMRPGPKMVSFWLCYSWSFLLLLAGLPVVVGYVLFGNIVSVGNALIPE